MSNAHYPSEFEPPTPGDYDVVKWAMLTVAEEPDARVFATKPDGSQLYIKLERLYADTDFLSWPLLTVCVSGLLTSLGHESKMLIRYRELAHHEDTENSSVNHDYILRQKDGEVVEFGHSMRAAPMLPEQRMDPRSTNNELNQLAQDARYLRQNLGNQLELTAGDCAVLFDRLLFLAQGQPSDSA